MHRRLLRESLEVYEHSGKIFPEERDILRRFSLFLQNTPLCFSRNTLPGHFTASCWLWNFDKTACLFTEHAKLKRWLQLGGHADGEHDLLQTALREAREESGISAIVPVSEDIFDLAIHEVPSRKEEPAHLHYDVRYILHAKTDAPFSVSNESLRLKWILPEDFENYFFDSSILRMREKISRMPASVNSYFEST